MFAEQTERFRLNYSYRLVLRNSETDDLHYFHSSHNNARVLDTPSLISTQEDLDAFLENQEKEDGLERMRQKRGNSKWSVDTVTNVTLYVNHLQDSSYEGFRIKIARSQNID